MTPAQDGLPLVGRSARMLGVRVPPAEPSDVTPDAGGDIQPGGGGLSVAPTSMWNLPAYRRPRGMQPGSTGKRGDRVYGVLGDALVPHALAVRLDEAKPTLHGFVEPIAPVPLASYEAALANTRPAWRQEWP